MVTDRPCTRNAATATPDSTTHQRCRSAYVIVINCDLSPSSATTLDVQCGGQHVRPFDASPGTAIARSPDIRSKVSPTASAVRRPGARAPACRHDDCGLLSLRLPTANAGLTTTRAPQRRTRSAASTGPTLPAVSGPVLVATTIEPTLGDYGADAVDRRRARQDGSRTQSPGAVRDPSRVSHRGGLRGHPSFEEPALEQVAVLARDG